MVVNKFTLVATNLQPNFNLIKLGPQLIVNLI
jgi:hypothetical protein